jgi:hypothetical protein
MDAKASRKRVYIFTSADRRLLLCEAICAHLGTSLRINRGIMEVDFLIKAYTKNDETGFRGGGHATHIFFHYDKYAEMEKNLLILARCEEARAYMFTESCLITDIHKIIEYLRTESAIRSFHGLRIDTQ